MKLGTIITLPDGREGTVVYHNLNGYGIVWGTKIIDPENIPEPEAMLRAEDKAGTLECVGEDYIIGDMFSIFKDRTSNYEPISHVEGNMFISFCPGKGDSETYVVEKRMNHKAVNGVKTFEGFEIGIKNLGWFFIGAETTLSTEGDQDHG